MMQWIVCVKNGTGHGHAGYPQHNEQQRYHDIDYFFHLSALTF